MIKIREVSVDDTAQLLEIYALYVRDTAISFEYTVPSIEEFHKRVLRILQKYPYLVAEEDGKVLGYAYADEFKGREAFNWTVETSIYVESGCRNSGIGRKLYDALEQELRLRGFNSMCACIAFTDDSQDPYLTNGSVNFHEKQGFSLVAHFHRCGWKFSRWYDMVWMEKLIGDEGVPRPTSS